MKGAYSTNFENEKKKWFYERCFESTELKKKNSRNYATTWVVIEKQIQLLYIFMQVVHSTKCFFKLWGALDFIFGSLFVIASYKISTVKKRYNYLFFSE